MFNILKLSTLCKEVSLPFWNAGFFFLLVHWLHSFHFRTAFLSSFYSGH